MAHALLQTGLSLETSHSTSVSHTPSRTSLGIYVTFNIIHLVSAIHARVRTQIKVPRNKRARQEEFCTEFEQQAFEQIDQYLGRGTNYPRARPLGGKNSSRHERSRTGPIKHHSRESEVGVSGLLARIDTAGLSGSLALSSIASQNDLFLQRKSAFRVRRLSLKDHIRLVDIIQNLLDGLRGQLAPSELHRIGQLDHRDTYVANLEHLLLCLQGQLLRLVVARLIEELVRHVKECQKRREIQCDEHVSEFPSAKRPLSTTWPWSIRPSLAVLWGVCWMFYDSDVRFDSEGNMIDVHGSVIAPHYAVEQYVAGMRRQSRQQAPGQGSGRIINHTPLSFGASAATRAAPSQQAVNTTHSSSNNNTSSHRNAYSDALSPYSTSSTAPALPATYWAQQDSTQAASSALPFSGDAWLAAQQPHAQQDTEESGLAYAPAQSSLPRSRVNPTQPSITVGHWPQDFPGSQPQDDAYSAAPAHSPLYTYIPSFNANMSLPYPPMPQDPDNNTMQTPVSPISADNQPHEMAMDDQQQQQQQISRKRSHSVMSQQDPSLLPIVQQNQSQAGSIASPGASPNGVNDEFSPRGSRAFKRNDPPTNQMGKYICTFSDECAGQTFERKCEWSKHMDKHDRPYRCPHPQCAKLQGFTYSGGLLRHEREVHGKHGGPKSQLMCPHTDCKRHTGKGFTRKENLNEHLRRVHPGDNKDSQNSILTRTATDGLLAEDGESQLSKIEGADQSQQHDEEYPGAGPSPAKRKRSLPADIDGVLIEDPEREIKRLRAELAHRDHLIQQMEQDLMAHHETRRQLEELQQQMHQGPPQAMALQPNQA